MQITAFELAGRYLGVKERSGDLDHPLIQWWLSLCGAGDLDRHDEVPWCSAFMNGICWELDGIGGIRVPRTDSLLARSWIGMGREIRIEDARPGWDFVVLSGLSGAQPWQGHVGWFKSYSALSGWVELRGGNQGNQVRDESFNTRGARAVLYVGRLVEV